MAFVAASLFFPQVVAVVRQLAIKQQQSCPRTQQRIFIIARTPLGVSRQHMSSFPLPLQRRNNFLPKVCSVLLKSCGPALFCTSHGCD
jgi:hypothetical protein